MDTQHIAEAKLDVAAAEQNLGAAEKTFNEAKAKWIEAYNAMSDAEGRMWARHSEWNSAMCALAVAEGTMEEGDING